MGSAVPKIVKIKHFPLQINCIQSLTATMRISFKSEEVIVTLDFNQGTVHFLWGRGGWWNLEECNLKIV